MKKLSGDKLADGIAAYEDVINKAVKPMLYGFLLRYTSQQDKTAKRLVANADEEIVKIASLCMFWALELRVLRHEDVEQKLSKSEKLRGYKQYIDHAVDERRVLESEELSHGYRTVLKEAMKEHDIRDYVGRHLLSEVAECLLALQSPVGPQQLADLLNEERTWLTFNVNGQPMDETRAEALLQSASEAERRQIMSARAQAYHPDTSFMRLATQAMNVIIKNGAIDDLLRGFTHPMESQNLSNEIEDDIVGAMLHTVYNNYHRTSHHYHKLKAKIMGTEKLAAHDEFAPPPGTPEHKILWEEAKHIVLEAYDEFSPEMAKYARRMFEEGYIDAEPRKGKSHGAFAVPPIGGVKHPFLFMNFQGSPSDVITLAHELGHNVHQWMINETQGNLMDHTPLTLAETASTFGEELVFDKLMKRAKSPAERKALMMERIERELGTVDRQVQYAQFELEAHNMRRAKGELSTEDLSAIWLKCLKERAGPDYEIAVGQEHQWARIPHLLNTPFYVYSYAVGDSLAGPLFEAWRGGEIKNFDQEYIKALKAGGTKHHETLLKPFGFDISDPKFWKKGLALRIRHIDELEKLVAEERAQAGLRTQKKAAPLIKAIRALDGTTVTALRDCYLVRVPFTTSAGYIARIKDTVDTLNAVLDDQVTVARGIITIPHPVEGMHDMLRKQLDEMAEKTKKTACAI